MPCSQSSPVLSLCGHQDQEDDAASVDTYSLSFSPASSQPSTPSPYGAPVSLPGPLIGSGPTKSVRLAIPCLNQDDIIDPRGSSIVMPHEHSPEVPKLGSGSKWTATQLDLLNVHYDPTANHLFHFQDMTLPRQLSDCTTTL